MKLSKKWIVILAINLIITVGAFACILAIQSQEELVKEYRLAPLIPELWKGSLFFVVGILVCFLMVSASRGYLRMSHQLIAFFLSLVALFVIVLLNWTLASQQIEYAIILASMLLASTVFTIFLVATEKNKVV